MIEVLSTDTNFTKELIDYYDSLQHVDEDSDRARMDKAFHQQTASVLRAGLHLASPPPWSIPTEAELAPMRAIAGIGGQPMVTLRDPKFINRVKYRFSAASVAISFLKAAPPSRRSAVRRIVLHEKRQSVANAECHALGLIDFCLENSKLHIERRVSFWRNICASQLGNESLDTSLSLLENMSIYRKPESTYFTYSDWTCMSYIIDTMAAWLTEASVLPNKGMPAGSFSLIFDGTPSPTQSSALFERIKEAAAWQVAQMQWYADHGQTHNLEDKCTILPTYWSEAFPQVINDIVMGTSFVSCDFDTGDLYDPEDVLAVTEPYGLEPQDCWHQLWSRKHADNPLRLLSPLPPRIADLALKDIDPEGIAPEVRGSVGTSTF